MDESGEEEDCEEEEDAVDLAHKSKESAKLTRKRRKVYIELLERKVQNLQQQIEQYRQSASVLNGTTPQSTNDSHSPPRRPERPAQ